MGTQDGAVSPQAPETDTRTGIEDQGRLAPVNLNATGVAAIHEMIGC